MNIFEIFCTVISFFIYLHVYAVVNIDVKYVVIMHVNSRPLRDMNVVW